MSWNDDFSHFPVNIIILSISQEDLSLLEGVDEDGDEEMVFIGSDVDKKCRQDVSAFINFEILLQ